MIEVSGALAASSDSSDWLGLATLAGRSMASQPLDSVAATRRIEQLAASALPPHTLMERAGTAAARLALALAPHARCIWVACGPGNNGGDGFVTALQLHQWGKQVVVTWTGLPAGQATAPPDAESARLRAMAAGLTISAQAPDQFDVCIDALLGLGGDLNPKRAFTALILDWLHRMAASPAPQLCIDVPTGLNADTGSFDGGESHSDLTDGSAARRPPPRFTLSLLTLKPGLFTARGRDRAGTVWFDTLGVVRNADLAPTAWLLGADRAAPLSRTRSLHASHKGSFGDVAVVGGESTPKSHMLGAALLAARAALHAGAGRVYVALLGETGLTPLQTDVLQPELMFRSPDALNLKAVIVCGCGGGQAIQAVLPRLLSSATRLVLDADALNAIAGEQALQTSLKARQSLGWQTIITPHPLEAARLLGSTANAVQADRLAAAASLVAQFGCTVVLKGSGTVIAAPGQTPCINSSGNALLATAGTGDVLAGMVGASLARGGSEFKAACSAVFWHGRLADQWAHDRPGASMTASNLRL